MDELKDLVKHLLFEVPKDSINALKEQEEIYKILINELKGEARKEAKSLFFVAAGTANVVYKERIVKSLLKGQVFGLSYLTRKIGSEFLGDIRAGLLPVRTFQFDYETLERRLSYFELALISKNSDLGDGDDPVIGNLLQTTSYDK